MFDIYAYIQYKVKLY